ncbi:MarR family transcriptional regulator [Streptomyces sp. DG2A-72]|uniref:MarR family transcriptional regulator n=1 Tax=Streptomyces sp. DG2A-72 TaxID=3051386 RepID=UPI00265BB67B|nr:MarR family transcriptional regulator [Streptomyces sp. DG2A-72]MDO0934891.1 MarR family transcriptional regulator [Streptomyces sp. DG2A-72]
MTDLAEAVPFSSGGFTRLADRMAKEGLIRRGPDPADRRAGPLSPEDRRHLERILPGSIPC